MGLKLFKAVTLNKKWIEGHVYQYNMRTFICNENHFDNATTQQNEEVFEESICMYTGLYDMNKKPIFEGDYISCFNDNIDGVIVWCEETAMFRIKWLSELFIRIRGRKQEYTLNGERLFLNSHIVWKVVGNIHDRLSYEWEEAKYKINNKNFGN